MKKNLLLATMPFILTAPTWLSGCAADGDPENAVPDELTASSASPLALGDSLPRDPSLKLAYFDEFDAPLNTTAWSYRAGDRFDSCFKNANAQVTGGSLHLYGRREAVTCNGIAYNFTAGGVISNRAFGYGYYETRAKLTPKKGWHSSFWQFSAPGQMVNELDGFEVDSYDDVPRFNLHYYKPTHVSYGLNRAPGEVTAPSNSHTFPVGQRPADMFHTYGWEWTPKEVIWYIDGVEVTRALYPGPHAPQNVWLTTLGWARGGFAVEDGADIEFNYFRYYTKRYGSAPSSTAVVVPIERVSRTGTWRADSVARSSDGLTTTLASSTDGSTATWQPNLPSPGGYEVFAWNPSVYSRTNTTTPSLSTSTTVSADFQVTSRSGEARATPVHQLLSGQAWLPLGAYTFAAGTGGRLTLTVRDGAAGDHRIGAAAFQPLNLAYSDFDAASATGWTPVLGTWSVHLLSTGNYGYRTTSTGEALTRIAPSSWVNYFVRASVSLRSPGAFAGVVGRYADAENYYLFRLDSGGRGVALLKRVAGTWTNLGSAPINVTTGIWYDLNLVLQGSSLRGLVNGVEVVNVEDTSLPMGTLGLRTYGGEVVFDRVGAARVDALVSPAP